MISFKPSHAPVAKLILEIRDTPLRVHRATALLRHNRFESKSCVCLNYSLVIYTLYKVGAK